MRMRIENLVFAYTDIVGTAMSRHEKEPAAQTITRLSALVRSEERFLTLRRVSGVALTVIVVAYIESYRAMGAPMPIPFLLLYMSIVFSANLNFRGGMVSAGIGSLFVTWSAHLSFGPPTLTGGPLQVGLGIVLFTASAYVIGITKRKSVLYLNELSRHEQDLQEQIEVRTAELQHTAAHLEEARERFFDFAKASADTFWELDKELIFCAWENPELDIQPWGDESLLSNSITNPELGFVDMLGWEPLQLSLEAHEAFRNVELEIPGIESKTKWLTVSAIPLLDDEGMFLGYRGVFSDITARRSLEEKINQAERIDTIGRFAQGVSHDFNNLLGVIHGHAELALLHASNTAFEAPLQDILDASKRGASLVERLAAFGSTTMSIPETFNVTERVNQLIPLLASALGAGIELKLGVIDENVNAHCDAMQFDNAILNLTINARDAIEPDGSVTIEAQRYRHSSGGEQEGLVPGNYVCLKVLDTGMGISPDVLKRMFEPFFTTKASHAGSGLGLSIVHKFIERSRGRVQAESAPGKGTTISLYLPDNAELSRRGPMLRRAPCRAIPGKT
jgi:signal transduction histidine kinase